MSDLSHERVRAYLQVDRASLTSDEQAAVDGHLRDCADCRAYADHVARLHAVLTQTLHQRWDAQPVPKFASRVLPRLRKSKLPRQMLNYAIGLGVLAVLMLLLQAFFTTQLQHTAQSPVATEPPMADTTSTPVLMSTAIAVDPPHVRPTPTPPSGRDFYRVQRLTNTTAGAFRPVVSPDRQRVAYASERNGNWDIYVIDLITKIETRLTDDSLPDMAPSWSPDGTRIAYQHTVPSTEGPVLVDYTVMNADGSNKRVVFSGAPWLKNEAPQWSPAGDRLAFSNGNELIAVALDDQSADLILQSVDQQPYSWPIWFDNGHLLYIGKGQMMFSDLAGNSQAVLALPDPVQAMAAAAPYIVYIQQQGATMRVGQTSLDEIPAQALATFTAGQIEHAAVSPNGQFVAIQTASDIVVVVAGSLTSGQLAPLFSFASDVPPSDLLGVAWLPDSSGFVYVGGVEGVPELHVAQLNLPAIDYLKALPSFVNTPAPTPPPLDTSALGPIETSFLPDPSIPLDGSAGFSFGATITATSQIDVIAHIVAFAVRPEEALADCTTRAIPSDRPFWANQSNFAPGQIVYSQGFAYAHDVPGVDRLVVRINLIQPGVNGRLLYCTQQVYQLLPGGLSITLTPMAPALTATPAPPTLAPTATPGPVLTSTPYEPPMVMPITDRDVAIQLALQADRNWVQRDRPITMEMIAADPTIVTVQRFASQAESGFGVNATIVNGPVWVVTLRGRGLTTVIGIGGRSVKTNEVAYEFLERTGTLLRTSVSPLAPTPTPIP